MTNTTTTETLRCEGSVSANKLTLDAYDINHALRGGHNQWALGTWPRLWGRVTPLTERAVEIRAAHRARGIRLTWTHAKRFASHQVFRGPWERSFFGFLFTRTAPGERGAWPS